MSTTTSDVFAFLESRKSGVIDRHEVAFAPFGRLRRNVRQIALMLRDSDAADQDLSDRMRLLICEWLTAPVSFHLMREALLAALPAVAPFQTRWGPELRNIHDDALNAAHELISLQNPLTEGLQRTIRQARCDNRIFKIYCHRRARPHFESLTRSGADPPLETANFLHSVRDYRDADLFDLLIKVGPLRPFGWGSVPDAILTAPRFSSLIQFVWSGCGDEAGFGYDPASSFIDGSSAVAADGSQAVSITFGKISWIRHVSLSGEDLEGEIGPSTEVDDLRLFDDIDSHGEERAATLIKVDAAHGILYHPHSHVLSFDPDSTSREPIAWRVPGETLITGMYVVEPVVSKVDLGAVRAGHGHYSRIWKDELVKARKIEGFDLLSALTDGGIDLGNLSAAIDNWCRPPSTVIHAPRRVKHFEILLRVLGLEGRNELVAGRKSVPFWRLAWDEVRRSRGEAIQAGFQEHEIVDDELRGILTKLLPDVRQKAAVHERFELSIPATNDIKGTFIFHPVCGTEEGFRAPESALRAVLSLEAIEQWHE
jgi:hypothetical protein